MARSSRSSSDEPTYESLRKKCTAANEYTTTMELSIGTVGCRFGLRRKSARMDIDLGPTLYNIVPDRWREIIKRHDEYVKVNFARVDWKDMTAQIRPDGLCVDVLREDVQEWFELLRDRINGKEGMTGVSPNQRKRGW
jgi:hypothetical protein